MVGGGAVVDDHGRSRAQREAGHALAQRHAQAGQIVAEAERGPRPQLALRLVGQEDGGTVGREDVEDDLVHPLQQHVAVGGGEAGLSDLGERLDLPRPPLEQPAGDQRSRARHQLLGQERLRHVVVGTVAQAAHTGGRATERAQHEDGNAALAGLRAQLLDDLVAAHAGQHEVEDQEVRLRIDLERLQGGLARPHRLDLVALGLEQVAQQGGRVAVVLDDENARELVGHRDSAPAPAMVAATTRARSSGV